LEPRDEPEPTPSETRPPSEREYVVLHRIQEENGDEGEVWQIIDTGPLPSRQAALEQGYGYVKPTSADDHEPRTIVAVPSSYFKPSTVTVQRVEQVKWEDG
jgi:hypothetical protein